MPSLTLCVLVLVLGAQVLCSPEAQSDSGETSAPEKTSNDVDVENEDHVMQKRAPSYDFGLGRKRGYTYLSGIKRLPVYNFGLGKRSPAYEFGLGKRPHPTEDDDVEDAGEDDGLWSNQIDQNDQDSSAEGDQDTYDVYPKRARPYSFGLGKRISPDSVEEMKRRGYEFGLGKRSPYEFGLGKRSPYEFGLGKRSPYEFGLGKRSPYEFGLGKKAYEFGLGKRAAYEFGLGKRAAYEFGLGKKSAYEFGLGKKSESSGKRLPQSVGYRQLYEFGLGRRRRDLNKFNFGLGKRDQEPEADQTGATDQEDAEVST